MIEIPITELKNNVNGCLKQMPAVITKRNIPVAFLLPIEETPEEEKRKFKDNIELAKDVHDSTLKYQI